MRRHNGIAIFGEIELSTVFQESRKRMSDDVHQETAEFLLNTNESQYVEHLISKYSFDPLALHFEAVTVSSREEQIPAERHDRFSFNMRSGTTAPRQVIRYHLPYEGDDDLLRFIPSTRLLWTQEVELEGGCICFDIIDFHQDPDGIKREADSIFQRIKQQAEHVTNEVNMYNGQLPGLITQIVAARKEQLQKQLGTVAALGVPVRQSPTVPETFRVPVERRKVIPKPVMNPSTGLPEPALGDDIYQAILKVIHDTGKVWERLPSTYADKEEEALRDHLIMVLTPHFEGSTTGETFNKSGKTDILMRHEQSNVFVAECFWWDGPKMLLQKIDQLLGYLTWRDSKAAVVCFVRRKDFTNVLEEIHKTVPAHRCYVSEVSAHEETWTIYEFHLNDDEGRRIKLAVLAFHLP